MLESLHTGQLLFETLTEEEKTRRGILGRLSGPIASFKLGTRNGRLYSDPLWEKVFQNDIVRELLKHGGIPGELGHPADREETDPEKIAIMMPEEPKKDKDGHLVTYFDIVDTPCGKIAYQLAKYGFQFGVSSRGNGDLIVDDNGNESVDPETYMLNAWDLVLVPACEDARMQFNESLSTQKPLNKILNESLNSASEHDKALMEEALKNLNINYSPEKVDNISSQAVPLQEEANTIGSEFVQSLQESLAREREAQTCIKSLQEKLSVCNAKEAKLERELQKYKSSVITLSDTARAAKVTKQQNESLVEKLNLANKQLVEKDVEIKSLRANISKLNESVSSTQRSRSDLETSLQEALSQLKEAKAEGAAKEKQLNESLADMKKNSSLKQKEFSNKLDHAQTLIEKYRKTAATAVNKYIELKALQLGTTVQQIRNQLNEHYSFSDIDAVCEKLQQYNINMNKLPFSFAKDNVHVKITESKSNHIERISSDFDDEIDTQLLKLQQNI